MYNIRSRGGVLLSELIQLFKIIEILVNQVGEHDEYILSLQEIVSTLGGAMLKERASDEQRLVSQIFFLEKKTNFVFIIVQINYL